MMSLTAFEMDNKIKNNEPFYVYGETIVFYPSSDGNNPHKFYRTGMQKAEITVRVDNKPPNQYLVWLDDMGHFNIGLLNTAKQRLQTLTKLLKGIDWEVEYDIDYNTFETFESGLYKNDIIARGRAEFVTID